MYIFSAVACAVVSCATPKSAAVPFIENIENVQLNRLIFNLSVLVPILRIRSRVGSQDGRKNTRPMKIVGVRLTLARFALSVNVACHPHSSASNSIRQVCTLRPAYHSPTSGLHVCNEFFLKNSLLVLRPIVGL